MARISTNIFFNLLSRVYETLTALVWLALIARYLGRDGFGDYSWIWAVMTMAIIVPETGLNNLLIREASKDREKVPELLRATIQVRRLLSIASVLIVIGIVFLSTKDPRMRACACISAVWIFGRVAMATNSAIIFAYERVHYDTLVTASYCTALLALLFAVVRLDRGLVGVLGAFALAACLGGVLSSIVRRWKFCAAANKTDRGLARYVLRESLPVGGSRAVRLTGNKIDTLVLFWLRTSGEVAIYSGVYNLILRIISIPFLISRPLFPLISQLADSPEEKDRFETVTRESIKLMFLLAMPLCMGLTVTADKVVYLIFGPEFEPAIVVMRILSWVLMFMFPSALAAFVAVAVNRQIYLLKTLTVCIGLNVVLDFLLIPFMGYYGACVATLVAETLFAFFMWRLLRQVFPSSSDLLRGYHGILLGAGVMGVVLYMLNSLNLLYLILLGPVIYVPCLFLFRAFTREEAEYFRDLLFRRREESEDRLAE